MILEYHRPETIEEALVLLSRQQPETVPLAGGSTVSQPSSRQIAVVDLQELNLDGFRATGNRLVLGATLTLQAMRDRCAALGDGKIPAKLLKSIDLEATNNLRQVASVAGTLVSADGRSAFTTAMLALDAELDLLPGNEKLSLGNLLPLRSERLRGQLIRSVSIPTILRLAFEYVARTPADLPIVCAALAAWPSGRIRLALGGFGSAPLLAFDGTDDAGLDMSAQSAYSEAGDQWASAEYRQEIAAVLTRRCLHEIKPI